MRHDNITVVLTSCQRHDLLYKTLLSLLKHVPDGFAEVIIIEDGDTKEPSWLNEVSALGKITWMNSPARMGQIWCVDKAYQQVGTPYIFHCEDDWEFDGPFVEQSLSILEQYPEVFTVSLRGKFCNGHPLISDPHYPFKVQQRDWHGFGAFNFNPGLRRLSDYQKIGSYGKHVGYHRHGADSERELSGIYRKLGYVIASLPPDDKEIAKHLGHGRSQAQRPLPVIDKILIAIPACHKYRYGRRINEFHFDSQPNRIDSQRNTWLKDVQVHSHFLDYKFFYGRGEGTPLDDEVFLDCGDSYEELPHKVKEICRYALKKGYSYIFKCDDDTFTHIDRLLLSDFRNYDQYGYKDTLLTSYIPGGTGYILNKKAMNAIVSEQVTEWAEDLWVGRLMRKHNLSRGSDTRFIPGYKAHYVEISELPTDFISCHAVRPDDMIKLYTR